MLNTINLFVFNTTAYLSSDVLKQKDIVTSFKDYNSLIVPFLYFFLGVVVLTIILALIISFVKLARNGSNPNARNSIINEIIVLFILAALTGAFPFIFLFTRAIFK